MDIEWSSLELSVEIWVCVVLKRSSPLVVSAS